MVLRTGAALPSGIGRSERRSLEKGGGRSEGVGDEVERGGKGRNVVGGRTRDGEGKEIYGLVEVRVELVEGVDVDGV